MVCFYAVTGVKNALGYDDALDVFGIHGVGGIVGAIGTGIVAAPVARRLRRRRILDRRPARDAGHRGRGDDPGWTGIGSLVLYKIVDVVVGLRVTPEAEREGLDLAEHGERAYNY